MKKQGATLGKNICVLYLFIVFCLQEFLCINKI